MTDKQIRKAAEHLGENALWLIKQILIKHDAAIIEASKEAIDAAVAKEREECAKVCEAEEQRILSKQSGRDFDQVDTNLRMIACVLPDIAAAIRARGNHE